MRNNNSNTPSSWSRVDDKQFEEALVLYPEGTVDRWLKIAAHLPGKNWTQVKQHYKDLVYDVAAIDSGRVELPGYGYDDELFGSLDSDPLWVGCKEKERGTERRKGVPWTEEEHRLFLIGLQRYGKGDWRSVSRNAVVSRTPMQVASHAQKYFLRQNSSISGKKDTKRGSIHDTSLAPNLLGPTNDPSPNEFMDHSFFGPLNTFQDPGSPLAVQGLGFHRPM